MNVFQAIILIALFGNTAIGGMVLLSNPKRRLNRAFFLSTLIVAAWLLSMLGITFQTTTAALTFWTRQVDVAAGFLPLIFFILNLVIVKPELSVSQVGYKIRYLLVAAGALLVFCQTSFFLRRAFFSNPLETVPIVEYGPGVVLFLLYFFAMGVGMVFSTRKTLQITRGVQRAESQFLLLGCVLSFSVGVLLFSASILSGTQETTRFMPLVVLILDGFVAYGIATRRILTVSEVLRRVVSYGLMALYLCILYLAANWGANLVFARIFVDSANVSHLLAALVVAFSVSPAHGWMQAVAHRLFASGDAVDINVLMGRASHVFREVSTEANLMANFSDLVSDAFGVRKVVLLNRQADGTFAQAYPAAAEGRPILLRGGSAVVELLRRDREALTTDALQRMRPTRLVEDAHGTLEELGAGVAVGSFMRSEMKAVLLLGPKKTRRIYDLRDQQALQLLCDQFAVALENANLYTAVQNGKIYNDILLDSLTSGIVAVDSDRLVTVFNQRAQELTRLPEAAAVGQPVAVLPGALAGGLEAILSEQAGFRDRDMNLQREGEEFPIRASGALLHGHTGQALGALLVFNDMTVLKKMEEQIRRTDRLSSIGTLSAGMAHEIKNPLVTIKTFAQLLPQQHHDSEFRDTFFDLVGQEVNRIDGIVNRLLNFARPAPPSLKPVSLHQIVENSIRLVEPQLVQSGMTLERHLDAPSDLIDADAEQLNQTFVNFFLNAIQAMNKGGKLGVRTAVVRHSRESPQIADLPDGDRIQIDVRDTGCGIRPDNLSKIFDPFFTTKEHGVGLGLSVSHGIILEHGGTIDVESELGKGSVFHIQFPLLPLPEPATP